MTSRLNPKLVERILAEISEEEIVAMCCDVINIPSPTGDEGNEKLCSYPDDFRLAGRH